MGLNYVNGDKATMEPLQQGVLEKYGDDFTPKLNIEWDDISIDTIIAKNDSWKHDGHLTLPTLARKVEGVNDGHLIEIGARPNTGKTSFHASMIAGPRGFAHQGAKCIVLCNEERHCVWQRVTSLQQQA